MLLCKGDKGRYLGVGVCVSFQQCQSLLYALAGAENLLSWLVCSVVKFPKYGVTYFLETGALSDT